MKKEILEKLQEIGFNPEPPILETILEALPNAISTKRGPAMFAMRKNSIFYEIERENKVPELAIGELKNESNWADTAYFKYFTFHFPSY